MYFLLLQLFAGAAVGWTWILYCFLHGKSRDAARRMAANLESSPNNLRRFDAAFEKVVGAVVFLRRTVILSALECNLFYQASKALTFSYLQSISSGTPYPGTKKDIESATTADYHRSKKNRPILGDFLSMEAATTKLERSLLPTAELSPSTEAALKRLRGMLLLENKDWGPDLVVKSFNDWDKVFFNRRLKNHVEICWRKEASVPGWPGKFMYGHQLEEGVSWRWRHVKIELNADLLLLKPHSEALIMREGEPPVSPFRAIWGALLHECCHAYLAILSGSGRNREEEAEGYDGGHGVHFQRCLHAVDRSSRALLGIAALCDYVTRDNRPQKSFDPKNHQVVPRDPRVPVLKRMGIIQMWRTCSHMARVLLRT